MVRRDLPPGGPIPDPDEEVRSEIEFHLEERARELEAEGMDPESARREAGRAFGDVARITNEVRRIRRGRKRDEGMRMMAGTIGRNVNLTLRSLARRPGFGAVVIGTLALGIGAVTAVFGVVNASLLRALPFEDADRLVFVAGAFDAPEGPAIRGASVPEATDWRDLSRSFEDMAAVGGESVILTGDGPGERLQAEQVGPGFFEILRVEPIAGRLFDESETAIPGDARVVVIGEDLWRGRFGSDATLVGRSIMLQGQPFVVIGVAPSAFPGTSLDADLWIPLGNPVTGVGPETAVARGSRWLTVIARLADGVTVEQAQIEMDGIAARLEADHPVDHEDRIAVVTQIREVYMGDTRTLVLIIFAATGLLLLIAGTNVANLLLVRTSGRIDEVLIRKAMGAGKGRIVGQLLTESMVLAAIGAAFGLILGIQGAALLADAMPEALLPAYVDVRPDLGVFLAAAGLMALVGMLAGLAPAISAARTDIAGGLRQRQGAGRSRLQGALVVVEVAVALLLMVGAGLMARSFEAQLAIDPGFEVDGLIGFRITPPSESYPPDQHRAALQALHDDLESSPRIAAASWASDSPLRGGYSASYIFTEGSEPDERIRFYFHRVRPDWFETVGANVLRGRALNRGDLANPGVTVISDAFARRFFADGPAVGQSLRLFRPDGDRIGIVGVAPEIRWRDLTTDIAAGVDDPDIYVMWDSIPSRSVEFVVRAEPGAAGGDFAAIETTIRDAVRRLDPDLPIVDLEPLSETLRTQTAQARFGSTLLGSFSLLAGFLALVGLYGVLSFTVDRRRREIAVRMAIGAEGGDVRRMVVSQGMKLAAAGLVLGVAGAWFATESLEAFLYGVKRNDVATYLVVVLLMSAVALLAAWVPALRATRVDPQSALKVD